jgi:hypothetical protein
MVCPVMERGRSMSIYDDGHAIDAAKALTRNALACDAEPEPRVKRMVPRSLRPPAVLPDVREQYDFEFDERMSIKMYSDMMERCGAKEIMPGCCAYHSTLLELGCVEFWDLARECEVPLRTLRPVSVELYEPEDVFCARCESVGHYVSACPFKDDEETRRLARLRRERKGRKAVAA